MTKSELYTVDTNTLVMYTSVPLSSAVVLEPHCPTIIILGGHGSRLGREIDIDRYIDREISLSISIL